MKRLGNMGREGLLFTSESVTCGHPDKLCDAISDAIVDACLEVDKNSRVAVETLVKTVDGIGHIVLAGEVRLDGDVPDYEYIARKTAGMIGYTDHNIGLNATSNSLCKVQQFITTQAANIAQGVDRDGAGDQGLMFGYACTETEDYDALKGRFFPLAAALSQRLTRRLKNVRELPSDAEGHLSWVRPDGKSQVTIEYDDSGKPSRIHTVIIAIQHDDRLKDKFGGDEEEELEFVKSEITKHVIEHALPSSLLDENTIYVVNGTGRFADPGGPQTDAGLTGRKVIVDTYGGMGRHGGGAFSGKDPSKVDRSAAYLARYVAKNIVAAGIADRCELQLSYAIGVAEPTSISVETFGTGRISDDKIVELIRNHFELRPKGLIQMLGLLRPIYRQTAAYGHFGREEPTFTWEQTDKAAALKSDARL